jgi:hypothetical protein
MNLSTFNTALLANSFWRAVSVDSIWHRIIADKYLNSLPLIRWIRKPSFLQRNASPFWKGMVASLPVILHWLVWKPGAGTEIRIGEDKILGLGDRSLLSAELRLQLQSLNLTHLAQVKTQQNSRSLPDSWMNSDDLLLCNPIATEWDHYVSALKGAGVTLSSSPDSLLWAGGDATGSLSVKNLYIALHNQRFEAVDNSWFSLIWRWELPLKLKLFIWLAGKEKPLTWEALRRRGWEGPGICPLCCKDSEDIHHLLVFVPSHSQSGLRCSTISRCIFPGVAPLSLTVTPDGSLIPQRQILTCYCLLARLECSKSSHLRFLSSLIASVFIKSWPLSSGSRFCIRLLYTKSCDFIPKEGYTVACFDGAALSSGGCCGAGGIFKFHPSRCTLWFLNCGMSAQIIRPSSWAYGPHSILLPAGLSVTFMSSVTRD